MIVTSKAWPQKGLILSFKFSIIIEKFGPFKKKLSYEGLLIQRLIFGEEMRQAVAPQLL